MYVSIFPYSSLTLFLLCHYYKTHTVKFQIFTPLFKLYYISDLNKSKCARSIIIVRTSNTKTSPLSLYSQYPLFVFEDINGEIRDKYRLFNYYFFRVWLHQPKNFLNMRLTKFFVHSSKEFVIRNQQYFECNLIKAMDQPV